MNHGQGVCNNSGLLETCFAVPEDSRLLREENHNIFFSPLNATCCRAPELPLAGCKCKQRVQSLDKDCSSHGEVVRSLNLASESQGRKLLSEVS